MSPSSHEVLVDLRVVRLARRLVGGEVDGGHVAVVVALARGRQVEHDGALAVRELVVHLEFRFG